MERGAEISLVSAGSLCEQVCVEAGSCLFGRDMFVESQMKDTMKKEAQTPITFICSNAEAIHTVFPITETAPDRDRRS